MIPRLTTRAGLALVFAVFLVAYVLFLGARPLSIPDEVRYAEMSREMLVRNDWVSPRLLGLRYFEKPVAGYWLNNLSQMAFGHTNFAVRFSSAMSVGLTAFLAAIIARAGSKDKRTGWCTAAIYLSCFLIFGIGVTAVLDSMLTLWSTAALAAFWYAYSGNTSARRWTGWTAFGVACGLAFLTKGFVALAVQVVAIAPFMLLQKRWLELIRFGLWSVLVAGLVSLPWSLAIHAAEPDYWNFFFWNEHVRRFTAENAQHAEPAWFFLMILPLMLLPWTPLFPGALRSGWRRASREEDEFARFLLFAFLMPFCLFSASRGKLTTYILPCMAPVAILLAQHTLALLDTGRERALRVAVWFHVVLAAAVLIALGIGHLAYGDNPYMAGEGSRHLVVALSFGAWLVLGAAMLKRRLPYPVGLAALVVCLAWSLNSFEPRVSQYEKSPQALIVEVRDRVAGEDVAIASASVRMSPGVAWEFERKEIYIVGGHSELGYGLKHPDDAYRSIPATKLNDWIERNREERGVLFFAFEPEESTLGQYPIPTWQVRRGEFVALYYDRDASSNQ